MISAGDHALERERFTLSAALELREVL